MRALIVVGMAAALAAPPRATAEPPPTRVAAADTVPRALIEEHLGLSAQLAAAVDEGGAISGAALQLATVLTPHMAWEEEVVQPLLAALRPLALGEPLTGQDSLTALADSMAARFPEARAEHLRILAAAEHLAAVARTEGDFRWNALVEQLREHATLEEQVLYPAAVLAGETLRARAWRRY